ncbi:MAG: Asp-tRNA(Asn)/Glu-tRNA(Gln) amidotransferase subunit GatA [Gemmatimonadota bacterium]
MTALGPDAVRRREAAPDGLNAFVSFADEADDTSSDGPLAGAWVAVKDNLATLELPTTCGSRILEGYVSPFEATAVRRLREAGGRVLGKTNMDEFGMGSSTESSAWGPSLNPHDRDRVPGGSSGGSAAAVAAGYVRMALGSDTGGSVRQPAAFCGVVGIKPTYGRVSRYGLVAYASSLDQVGTFGRTVDDAARLLDVVAGPDPRDATSVEAQPIQHRRVESLEGLTVGLPSEYWEGGVDAGVRLRLEAVREALREGGATVTAVSLPSTARAIPAYYVLAPAEASSNLSRYDGVRFGLRTDAPDLASMVRATRSDGFGVEVKRRIMLGAFALSAGYYDAYYGAAQRVRREISDDFRAVFDAGVDVLLTPTTPGPAFRLGEKLDDPLAMYLQDVFTVPPNLAGLPAMSVPAGTVDGLPVGAQLIGPWWQEATMIAVARVIEARIEGGP